MQLLEYILFKECHFYKGYNFSYLKGLSILFNSAEGNSSHLHLIFCDFPNFMRQLDKNMAMCTYLINGPK